MLWSSSSVALLSRHGRRAGQVNDKSDGCFVFRFYFSLLIFFCKISLLFRFKLPGRESLIIFVYFQVMRKKFCWNKIYCFFGFFFFYLFPRCGSLFVCRRGKENGNHILCKRGSGDFFPIFINARMVLIFHLLLSVL